MRRIVKIPAAGIVRQRWGKNDIVSRFGNRLQEIRVQSWDWIIATWVVII